MIFEDVLGIIVHFEDTLLSNYYFLDPQYLAELLAQLIATEQTNGLARHGFAFISNKSFIFEFDLGLMKISELSVAIEDASTSILNNTTFLLRLLQKFDLAITWDNQHLIFPPLLPTQLSLNTIVRKISFLNISLSLFVSSRVIVEHRLYHHQVLFNFEIIHLLLNRFL